MCHTPYKTVFFTRIVSEYSHKRRVKVISSFLIREIRACPVEWEITSPTGTICQSFSSIRVYLRASAANSEFKIVWADGPCSLSPSFRPQNGRPKAKVAINPLAFSFDIS